MQVIHWLNSGLKKCVELVVIVALLAPSFAFALVPNDPELQQTGGVEILQLPQAWDIVHESPHIVVAVIDAGVDIHNPDLTDNIWINPAENEDGIDNDGNTFVDDVHGWNFVQNNNDVRPNVNAATTTRIGLNHGSVIAGIIGAVGNNAIGGAGVNWRIKLLPLKILDESGDGDTDMAVRAIDYAIQKKVDIINLSFVGPTPSLDFIQAVRRAYRAGILVVAAAGNAPEGGAGLNLNFTPQYPVCFDDPLKEENWVIGVAALNASGSLASFSNHGSKCIDISAPGHRLPSTVLYDDSSPLAREIYGGTWSGTSVAAPFVTGVAALVKSVQPTWGPDQIRKALLETVDSVTGNTTHAAGIGSVNAYKAVRYAQQGGDGGLPTGFYVMPVATGAGTTPEFFNTGFEKIKRVNLGKGTVSQTGITTADIDGTGIAQIIASVADVRGSLIRVVQRDGKLMREFRPFGKNERGGMAVAAHDVDLDGNDELIVASEKLRRIAVLESAGTVRSTITVPERRGTIGVAAYRQPDRTIIAATVQQGTQAKVYVWDGIGSFISSFDVKLSSKTLARIGFKPTTDGVGTIYMTQQVGNTVVVRSFSIDGIAQNTVIARPSSGTIIGHTFGFTSTGGDDKQLVLSTAGKKFLGFEVIDSVGHVTTSLKKELPKVPKYSNLYFGR